MTPIWSKNYVIFAKKYDIIQETVKKMFSSNTGSDGSCHSGAMQIECFVMDLFILSGIGGLEWGIKAFLREANEIGYTLNRN